jgi:rubrerythrin
MNIRENLEMSFRVETLAEKIYLSLSELFPEAGALFERLSSEESRHADIVAISMKLLDIDQLPAELAIDMEPLIKETISIAGKLEDKLERKEITLEEALQLSIELEESGAEAYLQEVLLGQTAHESLNYVKQFCKDCEFHTELIREFRDVLELKKAKAILADCARESKLNCWEVHLCGRHSGSEDEQDALSCPAATDKRLSGVHGGQNAGRACWVVAGTSCKGAARGAYVHKFKSCRACDFYLKVREEEGSLFQSSAELLSRLEKE